MNPDTKTPDLLRKLEQATLPADVDAGVMDDETARLRESWLALGQMLAGSPYEPESQYGSEAQCESESQCDSEPRCEPVSRAAIPLPPAPTKRVASRRIAFYPSMAIAMTCAALLAAVLFGGWSFMAGNWLRDTNQQLVRLDTNSGQDNAGSTEHETLPVEGDQPTSTSEWATELAWDDSLDGQLARTQIAMWEVDVDVTNHEKKWEHLINEFQSISDDLEGGSL